MVEEGHVGSDGRNGGFAEGMRWCWEIDAKEFGTDTLIWTVQQGQKKCIWGNHSTMEDPCLGARTAHVTHSRVGAEPRKHLACSWAYSREAVLCFDNAFCCDITQLALLPSFLFQRLDSYEQ